MKGYKKILVPLDGSETSEAILPEIEKLASAFGSSIALLHIVPPLILPGAMESVIQYETVTEALMKDGEAYLRAVEKRLKDKGVTVESRLVQGNEAHLILEHCDRKDIDLLAMTTHGRSGVSRWLLGSVAEKVIRHATKPILLIRSTH
ncbi:MAG: universal stress protein [Deltaproteobacteria bacterium]|jgi:nucleotide-binding universal stress UspA family protein